MNRAKNECVSAKTIVTATKRVSKDIEIRCESAVEPHRVKDHKLAAGIQSKVNGVS